MVQYEFHRIPTNGIHLRAVVEGKGALCILVHGWPESWYSWRHQIEPLVKAGYRVCVPDVRGYGGSDKPEAIEAYDLKSITGDIVGLIDALGERRAILIGHDWGAPIVWTTAVLHPTRVSAACGMSVPFLGRPHRPVTELYRDIFKDEFFYQLYFQQPGVAEAELETDVRTALRKIYFNASGDAPGSTFLPKKAASGKLLDGLADPDPLPKWLKAEDIEYYTQEFQQSGFRGPLNRYRNFERDWEMLPELGERLVEQPSMFLAGSKDPVLRFIPGMNLFDVTGPLYKDLRVKRLVEGAGHWVQQEQPEETNDALLEFLGGLRTQAS